jgi:hypothetical protein
MKWTGNSAYYDRKLSDMHRSPGVVRDLKESRL